MRILVAGREGQVARALSALSGSGCVVEARGRPELDVTDRACLDRAVAHFAPDIVVNAAGYTAVEHAETDAPAAFGVNCEGARNIAAAAAAAGRTVIHISTDYVFAGEGTCPHREEDATAPLNVYGLSKLAGEEAVRTANPAHVILRTSWIHAPWGNNFVKTMLRLAAERDVVRVVADQYGAPTYAPDLAQGILAAARRVLAAPGEDGWRGVFNLTAGGQTSWAGCAEAVFAESASAGGPTARVEPIATCEYPTPARRPANSRLDNSKFHQTFGYALPDWRDGVRQCVAQLLSRRTVDELQPDRRAYT